MIENCVNGNLGIYYCRGDFILHRLIAVFFLHPFQEGEEHQGRADFSGRQGKPEAIGT